MTTDVVIDLPYSPHWGQKLVHDSPKRFRVLLCGRGWGKDRFIHGEIFKKYSEWSNERRSGDLIPPINMMVVGPTYEATSQNWDELQVFAQSLKEGGLDVKVVKDEKYITLPLHDGVCRIAVRSADRPESLLGKGYDLVALTEADDIPDIVWDSYISPMLARPGRKGFAIIVGTPRREESYFSRLYDMGGTKDVDSFHFTSFDNPYMDVDALMSQIAITPEHIVRQEYYAERQADVEAAFRNVDSCATGIEEEPKEGHEYVMGIDLGQAVDWTVEVVIDKAVRRAVYMDRFSKADWGAQKGLILRECERWNQPLVVMDTANIGKAIFDDLKDFIRIKAVNMHSSQTKDDLIRNLQLALEKETLRFPRTGKFNTLISELKMYRRINMSKTGIALTHTSYRAPVHKHDDCVVALALALDGCPMYGEWYTAAPVKQQQPIRFF